MEEHFFQINQDWMRMHKITVKSALISTCYVFHRQFFKIVVEKLHFKIEIGQNYEVEAQLQLTAAISKY